MFGTKLRRVVVASVIAGSALVCLAGPAGADPNAPYIGYGYSTNPHAVWCVQHDLNYYIAYHSLRSRPPYGTIAEDSTWGNQTFATVEWFQGEFSGTPGELQIDGIVGPMTGSDLLGNGDPHANGSAGAPGYCWGYLPGDFP